MNRRLNFALCMAASIFTFQQLAAPADAAITHRYSFTGNANDSVGSANWTVNGAAFGGGAVVFDGVNDYLNLAANPLPASGSTTIEVWGTYAPGTAPGSRIFDFSNSAMNYLLLTPNSSATATDSRLRWDDGAGLPLGPFGAAPANIGEKVLFTAVVDHTTVTPLGTGELRLYRDGALVASASAENLAILAPIAGATSNRLGHGTSTGPIAAAFLNGSIDEFRTYNHVLSTVDVLTNAIAGPDVTSVAFTDKTWNVAGSSGWNTAGNWTAAGVPAVVNRAVIGNGGTATVSAAAPQAGALRITSGALTVSAGGSLDMKYPIELQPGASNSAAINVSGGGRLTISGIINDAAAGAKTINIDNGTIAAGFASALVNAGATATIGAGGATLDTGSGRMEWDSTLAGSGNVTKTGAGTLVLRPATIGLAPYDQNPNFTGEFFINGGSVDVQREHGVFGRGGSTHGGKIHVTDSRLIINTAYPTAPGYRKEFPADVEVNGQSELRNLVDRVATEIIMSGSISGAGTLEVTKPNLPTDPNNDNDISDSAEGLDFVNRANPDVNDTENPTLFVDNSNFTGRIVTTGDWATRIRGETADFPNGIVELNGTRAWMGKRGTDANQTIELGGVAGSADVPNLRWSRLVASIAASGALTDVTMEDFNDVTYMIGGASQNAEFFGRVEDTVGAGFVDKVTVLKRGNNTQTFAGPNTYSGTTTINGGTLMINGTHSRDALELAGGGAPLANAVPVADYTVNAGGTLGGTGSIGSVADPVDVHVIGGTLAPGASAGTLTVNGNYSQDAPGTLAIELAGTGAGLFDKLAVAGTATLAGTLNIDLINGFVPATGNSFTILTAGSVVAPSLTLAGESNGFVLQVNPTSLVLNFTAPAGVPGDYNSDNHVDAADYTVWRNKLGGPGATLPNRDANNSGVVNQADYTFWKSRFGTGLGAGGGAVAGAVPEPSSLALVVMVAGMVGIGRRRR